MIKQLAELIPEDIFVGTSLIIGRGDRFLYGIRPVKVKAGQPFLEVTGIGGGLEADDPGYWAGAQREALEEIGCGVTAIHSSETLVVRGPELVEKVSVGGDERPVALVFRYHRTPPHRPWHPKNLGPACLIIFHATLDGEPRPTMELPWLIWLTADQVLLTARQDVPLGSMLDGGAELVTGETPLPSPALPARLTDSQEALALALDETFLTLYQSFSTGT